MHYLIGASLLLRARAIDQVAGLDEGFFLYWEDTDLCFRLRAAGWRLAVAGQALVFHRAHGSLDGSDPRFDFHYHVSAARFFRRHAPVPLVPILVGTLARTARRLLRGDWWRARAVLRGTWVGLEQGPGNIVTPRPPA